MEESVTVSEVQAFLKRNRWRENVYMITAISVAVGATNVVSTVLWDRSVHMRLGIDSTAAGVPLTVGPGGDGGWGGQQQMRFEGGSDFVFAFRLREVCYSVKRGVKVGEFTKGALYG